MVSPAASSWPAAVAAGWHPVAFASAVRSRPVAATLMGRRLVVVRDAEGVFVLDDRCPHRGAPLSRGRVDGGAVVCPYHGWAFGRGGACLRVPGTSRPGAPARALPAEERAGLVWTSLAESPGPFPRLPACMDDPSLDRFWWPLRATRAGLLDAIENHLDPSHPHHVHPWRRHDLQGVERVLGPQLLDHPDHAVGHDHPGEQRVLR